MKHFTKHVTRLLTLLVVFSLVTPIFLRTTPVSAVSAAEWNAGNIIDDAIFYDKSSMNVNEIQAFLNSKLPVCDTAGAKTSEYGGGTRAQYGTSKGYPAPFVCLKDYREDPATKANNLHGSPTPPGGISAAQIIWNVSQQFNISPKVMLVMLHKESDRLIIDDWPWSAQYRAAMGYGCPDTGPNYSANCSAEYYGFYNQMYNAARQLRRYATYPQEYRYKAGQNNTIQFSPDPVCGSANVYIQNQATASLYNYTPYQPNQAALEAGYGEAHCGAYGNRNFWKLYNDWFGSTNGCPLSDSTYIYRLFRVTDENYLYTQNPAEICQATKNFGYVIEGAVSKNNVSPSDEGARSVFRLSRNGIYIFTTDPIERDMAMQRYGYRYEGVGYYVSSVASGRYPMHRLSKNGRYVFTVSEFEKEAFRSSGYNYEGTPYYANSGGLRIPVYRVSKNGQHLYTSSQAEKNAAVSANGYSDQGIAFYGLSEQTGDNLLVYRLNRGGAYLNTTYPNEKMTALVYNYKQQTSFLYTYPANYPGTVPVFRLSNPRNGDYLLTTNTAERDSAVQTYGYRYEGVGFNGAP